MSPLTECARCQTEIWPRDVYKVTPVDKSPPYVALAYKCSECARRAYVVSTEDEWDEMDHEGLPVAETNLRVALFDLDGYEGPEDLIRFWASLWRPPIREEVMHACGCAECRRRLYGGTQD